MSDPGIRVLAPADVPELVRLLGLGFLGPPADPPATGWQSSEPDRARLCTEGGAAVGVGANKSLGFTVPGGVSVPAAGVTMVAVDPAHRRRGHLTRLVGELLDDAVAHGEPVAILTASSTEIYGRFGFGVSSARQELHVPRAAIGEVAVGSEVRVRVHDSAVAPDAVRVCFERVRATRPGAVGRNDVWWQEHFPSPGWLGGPPARLVTVEHGDVVDGYAAFRLGRHREVRVEELIAATPAAYAALWRFLAGLELTDPVQLVRAPIDAPARFLFRDSRAAQPHGWRDDVWARILDVPAALGARTYSCDGRVVVEVIDESRRGVGGRFAVDGGPAGATCARTDAEPDVTTDVATLASAWVGHATWHNLALAGRATAAGHDALARADAMFATAVAPWAMTEF